MIAHILLFTALPLLLILAAVWDLTSYTIPNLISLALIAVFALFATLAPLGWSMTGIHLLTGVAALGIGILFFALGWIGGGDAKLFASCALWLGWPDILPFILASAVAGGALSLLLLLFRSKPLPTILLNIKWINKLHDKRAGVPYGIALSSGFLFLLPNSMLVH